MWSHREPLKPISVAVRSVTTSKSMLRLRRKQPWAAWDSPTTSVVWSHRSCRKTTAGSMDNASKFPVAFISKDNTMKENERQTRIIDGFKAGNQRFLAGTSLHSSSSSLKKLKEYAKAGQQPQAIVLCCSDSRAPVELIF